MNAPRFITLDAAHTLIDVSWSPNRLGAEVAERLDLAADSNWAGDRLATLLGSRLEIYKGVNLTRSAEAGDAFWRQLAADWLKGLGRSDDQLDDVSAAIWDLLYGPQQSYFRLYSDTLPALEGLRDRGVRLAILSNWDYSLHRIAAQLGLTPYFETIVASLEEGVEKPEPELFRITLGRLGASKNEVWHVGDNLIDDVQGARDFGIHAIHLDRGREDRTPTQIPTLLDLVDLLSESE